MSDENPSIAYSLGQSLEILLIVIKHCRQPKWALVRIDLFVNTFFFKGEHQFYTSKSV